MAGPGRRGVQDRAGARGRGGALDAGVELRADRAQRQVRLGGEQQHEQCGLVAQVPGQQPQAHLHRHQRRGQRRRQLQHQRRQERHPQRAHRRLPVRLGDLTDHLHLRLRPAEQFQGGQPFDHVEEVPAECRQQPPLALRAGLGVQPDQDGEHRDQRQRHRDDHGRDPVSGRHPGYHRHRHHDREHKLGQVPGEVGIERVQALGGQGRDLPCLLPAQPGRAEPQRVPGQLAPQLGLDRGRGAQRHGLAAAGGHGAGDYHRQEHGQGRPQGRCARAAGRCRQGMGEQPRLGQHQGGHHQSQPDREDQVTPGCPGMPQQPGIDGPHTGGFGARISEMDENTRMTPPRLISPMRAARTLKWPLMPTRNSTVARYTVVRT